MKLHLVNDEKIINRTIGEFEKVFPRENLWVVANRATDFKLVENRDNVMARGEFLSKQKEEHFEEIYIHLLNPRKISLLSKIDLKGSKVYWIVWGLDLYNKLLVPKGFRLFAEGNSINKGHKIAGFFKNLCRKKEARKTIRFISDHIDYIVTDTTEIDYDYLIRYYPELRNKRWKDFFYYPIDVILNEELMRSETNGTDIMIGNSASATNNHEYVIDILSRLDTKGRRIVVPLSYSGKKAYVKEIIRKGNASFGEAFHPLLKFMPLEDYNRQQASTSVAIFGNLRQEAIGNIIIALYLGAKVFLIKSNPVYEWAQRHGLKVYDLECITQEDLDTPLDSQTRQRNREILKSLYTRERMHELISQLPEK